MLIPFGGNLLNVDLVEYFEFVAMRESSTGGGPVKIGSLSASQVPEVIQGSLDESSKNLCHIFAGKVNGGLSPSGYLKPYLECRAFTSSRALHTTNIEEMRQLFGG